MEVRAKDEEKQVALQLMEQIEAQRIALEALQHEIAQAQNS